MYTNPLEIAVYYVLPVLILAIGLFGNISGLVVLKGKKLNKLGPQFMYRLMFIFELIFLSGILVFIFENFFLLNLSLISDLSCKLYFYFSYTASNYLPIILVYLALDRFISIKYYAKRLLLKQFKFQFIFIISFFMFNSLFYIPVLFFYDISIGKENKSECILNGQNSIIVKVTSTFHSSIIFLVLLTLTFILSYFIFKARSRIESNYSRKQNREFRKELRLAITSVIFNLFYILIYLTATIIYTFFPNNNIIFSLAISLFFLPSCANFYILFFSHSFFRKLSVFLLLKSLRLARKATHRDQIHRIFYKNDVYQPRIIF